LPLYELGVAACERLVSRIRGKVDRVADVLPTHLVLRESTSIVRTR
jgi:DNA-binding LacI/PurR family transcriptional regulator